MTNVQGSVITAGVADWQIFQQKKNGCADIAVSGLWGGTPRGTVELRLVREDSTAVVAQHLNWQSAVTKADGSWSAVLKNVPAGGLYRLETHLQSDPNGPVEWQMRGDIRHFLGVGDLWIIAGQSNSAGYGRGPHFDPPEVGLHMFSNAMQWALASQPLNESTDSAHPENNEGGNPGHSPWLHFARLVRRHEHIPIGLVQVSLGGSPLSAWNPTDPGDHVLYELMIRVHRSVGGKVRGVLWYQGESDANPEQAPAYAERFVSAVKAWRLNMNQPELQVITVQLNRWMDSGQDESLDRAWAILRDQQRLVPTLLNGVAVVPTLDAPLTDGIHTGPAGNMTLAERAAQSALGMVYGNNVYHLAPEPEEARADKSGKIIEIAFKNVAGRMATIAASAKPFRVEDKRGRVDVEKIEYTNTPVIRLHLARALSGKAVVHGGYGANPEIVPFDMDRAMPMLAFYGFPVGRANKAR